MCQVYINGYLTFKCVYFLLLKVFGTTLKIILKLQFPKIHFNSLWYSDVIIAVLVKPLFFLVDKSILRILILFEMIIWFAKNLSSYSHRMLMIHNILTVCSKCSYASLNFKSYIIKG